MASKSRKVAIKSLHRGGGTGAHIPEANAGQLQPSGNVDVSPQLCVSAILCVSPQK